jgi:hypothetical protein
MAALVGLHFVGLDVKRDLYDNALGNKKALAVLACQRRDNAKGRKIDLLDNCRATKWKHIATDAAT